MKRVIAAFAVMSFLTACEDSRLGHAPPMGPSFDISEGRSGGNPDLFFGSPLATNPQPGDLNFDAGGSNGVLVPYVRVCETDGAASAAGCLADVTLQVTGSPTGLVMSYSGGAELYQVNWQTKDLVLGKDYRIEIWGVAFSTASEKAALDPAWLFGWRDISNSPSVSACSGTAAFCLIKYGQTIPVKVRIEQFVFCPLTRNCAVQFVAAGTDANLEAKLGPSSAATSAQLFIPAQTGTDFALAFAPCSPAEDAAVTAAADFPMFGPCLKTTTTFTGTLATPAIISLCDQLDASSFGLSHAQEHQLALHHFSNDLSQIQALPEAYQCGDATSGGIARAEPRGALHLAKAIGEKILGLVRPRLLHAAAMIDRGGGGESPFIASYYKLGLPVKFEYQAASDATQTGLAGSSLLLRAKVTDLFGAPVRNARIRWKAIMPPGDGATALGSAPPSAILTDALGVAQQTVQLSAGSGINIFYAFGRGIADNRETGCTVPLATPAACNGPRTSYDPFIPLHVPEFDASGAETLVHIPLVSRQLYTVHVCAPGFGTAVVDGNFTAGEWACAKSYPFTANVSGGSTPATLYVMNDGSTLYLAVRLRRAASDKVNTLQFNFDNNNSWSVSGTGAAQLGDDVLSLDGSSGFSDAYLTSKCVNSGQSSCWANDVSDAGSNNGSGSVKNDGTFTTYELSHPLNSGDALHDFALAAGAKVGLFLTLQTGSGATGNTQWPGFRNYLEIKIEQ